MTGTRTCRSPRRDSSQSQRRLRRRGTFRSEPCAGWSGPQTHRLREHRMPSAGDGVVMSLVALRALRIASPESRIPRLARAEARLSAEARPDEQRRHTPDRFQHDRPAHLGPARSPFIERNRDFDDVEAAHPGVMGELDLKRVAIRSDRGRTLQAGYDGNTGRGFGAEQARPRQQDEVVEFGPVGHDAEFKMRLYGFRRGRQLRCLRQPFQVRVDHHGDQSLKIYRRLPCKLPLRFRRIAD